jgi:hypothetical protein
VGENGAHATSKGPEDPVGFLSFFLTLALTEILDSGNIAPMSGGTVLRG